MKLYHIFSKNIVYLIILYSGLFGIYLFIFLCFIWINKTLDVEIQRFFLNVKYKDSKWLKIDPMYIYIVNKNLVHILHFYNLK